MKKKIVVIGAGVAGLNSSIELLKRGYEVDLIEARPKVGGMAQSVLDNGFTFDVGSHVIHTKSQKYESFIRDLLGENLLEKNITAKSYFDGKFHSFPPIMQDILDFPPRESLNIFFALCKGYFNRYRKKKLTFEEQLKFLAGKDLYGKYFKGYTAKFWGISPKNLSSEWVPKRVIPRFTGRSAIANEWQAYPKRGGIETIPIRMGKIIEKNGGVIRLSTRLKSLVEKEGAVDKVIIETKNGTENIACDALITTFPLPSLFEILGKKFALKYRSMIFVFLKLKGSDILPNTTICYFPSTKLPFTRLYEMSKYSPHNCPRGHTSLGVEIPCFFRDDLWNMSEDKIVKKVMEYLKIENIVKKDDLLGHITYKERYAYPIPSLEYYRKIEKLRNTIGLSNLFIAGRMGYFKYLDMCDAMESGKRAVNLLTSSKPK